MTIRTNPREEKPVTERAAVLMKHEAYERIVAMLEAGAVKPGQMITQRELMALAGVTLGSVREAVPRLEAEGLLETRPKRGLMVPSLDVRFVREAYRLRRMLELEALSATDSDLPDALVLDWISRHETLRERLASSGEPALIAEFLAFDWEMHKRIVGAMGNRLVDNLYRVNTVKVRMATQSGKRIGPDNSRRVIDEHLRFLRPLAEGRVQDACRALGQHIDNSLDIALGRDP